MKSIQRLDYTRLTEVLSELGVVEPATLQHILQQSFNTGELFPEVLVREGLIADWELSRIVCEAFHMVFLSVDFYEPSKAAVELVEPAILHQHALIPLDCYGDLLTISMPGLTPSEVLNGLAEKLDKSIQPVVGTAASNRRWLMENLAIVPTTVDQVGGALPGAVDDDWSSVFDEGDAAVLMDLNADDSTDSGEPAEARSDGSLDDDLSGLDDLVS